MIIRDLISNVKYFCTKWPCLSVLIERGSCLHFREYIHDLISGLLAHFPAVVCSHFLVNWELNWCLPGWWEAVSQICNVLPLFYKDSSLPPISYMYSIQLSAPILIGVSLADEKQCPKFATLSLCFTRIPVFHLFRTCTPIQLPAPFFSNFNSCLPD